MEQSTVEVLLHRKLEELAAQSRREDIAIHRAPDLLDDCQLASDRELAVVSIERDGAVAAQVRLALKRLKDGEYGTCVYCGQNIGTRRLSALPWASTCVLCQGVAERGDMPANGIDLRRRSRPF